MSFIHSILNNEHILSPARAEDTSFYQPPWREGDVGPIITPSSSGSHSNQSD